jgi:septum formation protein
MKLLVLASQSPRRKELLEKAGFRFQTLSVKVSEFIEKNLKIEDAILALVRRKSEAAQEAAKLLKLHSYILLTADTVVVIDNQVLGKPIDEAEAVDFLAKLSGKTHRVMTGVGLYDESSGQFVGQVDTTKVQFETLTSDQIAQYVATGEPMDKAGAYAIQGGAASFVARIDGDFNTVVGLNVQTVEKLLKENGWEVDRVSP